MAIDRKLKGGLDGLEEHFNKYTKDANLDVNKDIYNIMKWRKISIVASIEPNISLTNKQFDNIKVGLQDRVMTLEKHGGMNHREERKRGQLSKKGT